MHGRFPHRIPRTILESNRGRIMEEIHIGIPGRITGIILARIYLNL